MKRILTFPSRRLANENGVILFLVLGLIAVLILISAGLLMLGSSSSLLAERQRRGSVAINIAEAGLEMALYDMRQDFVSGSSPGWNDNLMNTTTVDKDNTDGEGFYFLYNGQALNDGVYSVKLKNATGSDTTWVRSTGTYMNVSRTVQIYAVINDVSVWNNVIFAGRNQTGNLINGNVNINGSVHILGTGLTQDEYAAELGGDAELVGNNYDGMDPLLRDRVPALPTVLFNGEMVETLNSELRVKNGIIGLDGSATVGQANVTGNSVKETVDGVFVNPKTDGSPGFGGTQNVSNVHSDNGYSNSYDLGDSMTFPSLSDEVSAGVTYQQHLYASALVIDAAADLTKMANITDSSSTDFSYGPDANGNSFSKLGDQITINGLVYVDGGGVEIDGSVITYSGQGSIFSTGDMSIEANLITPAPDAGDPQPTYPDNIIGFMTPGSIAIGQASQRKVMGVFYAEDTISLDKQTQVTGTLVTNHFNLGDQVPKIYQVPDVVNNLPPFMIEDEDKWYIKVVGWQLL